MDAECGRHRDRFSEYLDGELTNAERATVEAHLAQCAECRRELEAWRRMVGAVGELPAEPAPAGFAARSAVILTPAERSFRMTSRFSGEARKLTILCAMTGPIPSVSR
jgi:anti-sigma factor RsiW